MDSPLNGGDDFITRQTSNMNDAFAKWATPRRIEAIRESCAMTVVTHGAMGFLFGGAIGLFMSSMASPTPEMSNLGVLPQTKQILREMGSRTAGNAKSFAKIGALFSLYECVVETHRARHDIVNTLAAGCMTGATLSLKAGPKAALAGCAGFAAFSGAVEYFMQDRH